jgi:hypothetical protein
MRVPDRQKQRREYLRKKASLYQSTGLKMLTTVFCIAPLLWATKYLWIRPDFDSALWWLSVFIDGGIVAAMTIWNINSVRKAIYQDRCAAALLAYVPPVTPNTLPAEEVLVRGAQEPTQEQSAMLLRAAEESADTPSELLRAVSREEDVLPEKVRLAYATIQRKG